MKAILTGTFLTVLYISLSAQSIVLFINSQANRAQLSINDSFFNNHKIDYHKPTIDTVIVASNKYSILSPFPLFHKNCPSGIILQNSDTLNLNISPKGIISISFRTKNKLNAIRENSFNNYSGNTETEFINDFNRVSKSRDSIAMQELVNRELASIEDRNQAIYKEFSNTIIAQATQNTAKLSLMRYWMTNGNYLKSTQSAAISLKQLINFVSSFNLQDLYTSFNALQLYSNSLFSKSLISQSEVFSIVAQNLPQGPLRDKLLYIALTRMPPDSVISKITLYDSLKASQNHDLGIQTLKKKSLGTKLNSSFSLFDKSLSSYNIDSILQIYSNKVVIIDFWASWCSPCISELSILKQIRSEFQDKVKIIPISIDKSLDSWQYAIQKYYDFENEHFLCLNESIDIKSRMFQIKSIPLYIVIDNQGKLYQDDKLRPSEHSFIRLITDLVEGLNPSTKKAS